MPRFLALASLLLLAACALEPDFVAVNRPLPRPEAPMAGAQAVSVTVETRDNRTIRDRVSNKVNGYGMEMARISATNDVVAETREAITAELRGRGFGIGGTDARVELELTRFYSRFQTGFWTGTAAAEIVVNLRVLAPDGRIVFARSYNAEGTVPEVMIASGENARLALEAAMARLVQLVGDDLDLLRALAGLAPSAAPAPVLRGRAGS